ncbi:xyloside xylosyltransferase 1 isoform X2 [Onthophagus taurus]|nr:xyloside xylosyltransferase 1 isoform X2 [Onthophagus taurus]
MYNFKHLINNLLKISSVPLHFHIFVDSNSQIIAESIFNTTENFIFKYTYYNVHSAANSIMDIVDIMKPHFSSRPGTYYSDSLFYLSLGLYRIAPKTQKTAVMLDCDVFFKEDILNLFNEFKNFNESTLYGLAPELTPVYRHVLYSYKLKHNTRLGDSYPNGFQGYNSGVILINLSAIRKSNEYRQKVLSTEFVSTLTSKYNFKGHLGDQDFYTLLGFEHPRFFKTLSCGFNRQLCTWWRDHGYKDIFEDYFKCKQKVIVLHGNCNTRIPRK